MRHEVPGRLPTRHRDRAAFADLALEQWHDAAIGTQHVSEPHDHALHPVAARRLRDQHLRKALGRPHHARGPHRLVARDQHELPGTGFVRGFHDGPGAQDVVLHCFGQVGFHERHVLERSRVEHVGCFGLANHSRQAPLVSHVEDHVHVRHCDTAPVEFLTQEVEIVFVAIHEVNNCGIELRELPHQLGADRPRRPGDDDARATQLRPQCAQIELGLRPAQQIARLHFP